MTIKTNGAEWKAFMSDDAYWKEYAIEEEAYVINGAPLQEKASWDFDPTRDLLDTDKLEVSGGYVWDQGPSERTNSLAAFFKAWKKTQTHESLVFSVPKEKIDAVKAAVASVLNGSS